MQVARYLTLYQLKASLGEPQDVTIYDARFNLAINEASRLIDHLVRPRFFYPRYMTVKYDAANMDLVRVHDLMEIVSWTIDGVVQTSLDPLEFEPSDGPPYNLVTLSSVSNVVSFGSRGRNSLSITGFYGFLNEKFAVGLLDLAIDAASTSLSSTLDIPDIEIYAGRYLRIDNELMFVSATSGTRGFVVIRGINGSTAAAHASGTTLYIWDPPEVVQMLARTVAVRIIRIPQGAGAEFVENAGKAPFGGVITERMMQDIEELAPVFGP